MEHKNWRSEECRNKSGINRIECKEILKNGKCNIDRLWRLLGKIEWLARTLPFSRCWKRSLSMELRFRIQLANQSSNLLDSGLGGLGSGLDLGGFRRAEKGFGLGFRVSGSALGGLNDSVDQAWRMLDFDLSMASKRELRWWNRHAGNWINSRLDDVRYFSR